ncbi:ABC transporter substrate-binding protein [Paraburkholderia sp. SOS3]|jgi:ribose transport system substrate-binding protein|uniref:ABC transporter substrate-binding protein n=1 Tax=Paraburkholderia sp. SOS3 TaxID=1926494 RepID=UPI000947738B|nr:substrate-binding domain-containing protein [Paraburkholderia sp. SOS3]APR39317.1 sugar ABC transporter substrate-binding protein [Paraburkholderia sp. SOS3]
MNKALRIAMLCCAVPFGLVARAQAAEPPTYALILINQQAVFFNQMRSGAEEEAKKLGAKLVVFNANDASSAQVNAIDDYVQQKVDGIAIDAIDVNAVRGALRNASTAGIPVVGVDAVLPPGPQKAQVGVDNTVGAKQMATHFLDYVQKNLHGKAQVGIVGALSSVIQNTRQKGFVDALAVNGNVKIAGVVDGQNTQDVALSAAENLLTANPDLDAIYATGEPAMLGAIAAVQAQGRADKVKVIGWDLAPEVIRGIERGVVLGVVQQDPAAMGRASIDALNDAHKGKPVQAVVATPLTIVTKANVGAYRSQFAAK